MADDGFFIRRHDTRPWFTATPCQPAGVPIPDLDDADLVNLIIKPAAGAVWAEVEAEVYDSGEMYQPVDENDDPVGSPYIVWKVRYKWTEGAPDTAGDFFCECEIIWDDAATPKDKQTVPTKGPGETITVVADLDDE